MLVCGVDDAGRGSVLGPLVIAGISIEKSKIKQLVKIGVKDSKQLSPQSREKLYKQILSIVDGYHVAKISPRIIDKSVSKNLLNQLEANYMAKVIKTRSIDVTREPSQVMRSEVKKLSANFEIVQEINLEPYEGDHGMVIAKYLG